MGNLKNKLLQPFYWLKKKINGFIDFLKKIKTYYWMIISVIIIGIVCTLFPSIPACIFKYNDKESYFPLMKTIGLGVAAAITAILAMWRLSNIDKQTENMVEQTKATLKQTENLLKQTEIQDENRFDQQFLDALKLLGYNKANYSAKQGAVYILSALAQKSANHTQRCVDLLTSLNEWMGIRLQNKPDYFRLKGERYFVEWRRRIFNTDSAGLKKYAKSIGIDFKENNNAQKQELIKQIETERLSQVILGELEKIIDDFLQKNASNSTSQLKFDNRYICQINLIGKEIKNKLTFSKACMSGANLWKTNLQEVMLKEADLQNANLKEANLQEAWLIYANLQGAVLTNAHLQEAWLYSAKLQGAWLYFANLQEASLIMAELQGANLTNAKMQGANLTNANLQGTLLYKANLQGADLQSASLQGANLQGAKLQGADFENANLQGVYSSKAIEKDYNKSFEDRIKEQKEKEDDLSQTEQGEFTKEMAIEIEHNLNMEISDTSLITKIMEKINAKVGQTTNLEEAELGSYNEEDANIMIEEYKKATDFN